MHLSTTFYKSSTPIDVNPVIHSVVAGLNQKLADFVGRAMVAQNLSTHDVARRSGGRISHATVWNIQNGRIKNIQNDTLVALAKGLGVPEDELFLLVRGGAHQTEEAELLSRLSGLRDIPADRREVLITQFVALINVERNSLQPPQLRRAKTDTSLPLPLITVHIRNEDKASKKRRA